MSLLISWICLTKKRWLPPPRCGEGAFCYQVLVCWSVTRNKFFLFFSLCTDIIFSCNIYLRIECENTGDKEENRNLSVQYIAGSTVIVLVLFSDLWTLLLSRPVGRSEDKLLGSRRTYWSEFLEWIAWRVYMLCCLGNGIVYAKPLGLCGLNCEREKESRGETLKDRLSVERMGKSVAVNGSIRMVNKDEKWHRISELGISGIRCRFLPLRCFLDLWERVTYGSVVSLKLENSIDSFFVLFTFYKIYWWYPCNSKKKKIYRYLW